MKIKVLVYDDDISFGKKYADRLRAVKLRTNRLDVREIDINSFREELKKLVERQFSIREGKRPDFVGLELDDTDAFVVDYNLISITPIEMFLTGEEVAYVTRCFSNCGLIIGLNQYGHNPFDLTLRGHPESYADLNIGEAQLRNPALWETPANCGYRPWYWPDLPRYLESFKRKVDDVLANLKTPIPDILGLKDKVRSLPRDAASFFGLDLNKLNPMDFVLSSGNGLRSKDAHPSRTKVAHPPKNMIARITAARVSKWLERLVLPNQDVIVDAPHLVSRFPSLLDGDIEDLGSWNKTVRFVDQNELGIRHKTIGASRFSKDYWLSKPAWYWRDLSKLSAIQEISEPWARKPTKYVFAEDSSCFYNRSKCREFTSNVDSPYIRRYIRYFKKIGVEYAPAANLT